ncbi:Hypothetical predicted protein [Mytilus galloprovincialis]|uniref:Uncharacterized protein n=1 Tax=Mytilus galloprovincialis TaxID=29158 RepID=A0A8B6E8T4_MYTGA|nr:Hypothetical predicted protein [Mytilus galloprovincialis]
MEKTSSDSNVQPDFRKCDNNCDCICYTSIVYNVCTNVYTTTIADSSLPCSARLLDKSGISVNEDLTGLQSCFDPKCNEKKSKKDCYSEFQCSWCEFTFRGDIIQEPCCRIKGECSFGKTKDSNSDICDASHSNNLPKEAEGPSTGAIVGGTIGGLLAVILIVGGVIFLLRYLHINDNCDKEDPYLDAIPDHLDLHSAQNYGFESNGHFNPSSTTSNFSSGSLSSGGGLRHSSISVVSDESRDPGGGGIHTRTTFITEKNSKWQIAFDMDYYPFMPGDKRQEFLIRFLAKIARIHPGIGEVYLKNFLFLGKPRKENHILKRYSRRTPNPANQLDKPIYRMENILSVHIHHNPLRKGMSTDGNPKEIRMNHYWGARLQNWDEDTPDILSKRYLTIQL